MLTGGIPGVLLGCVLARKVPARKLKMAIALIAMFAGSQLIWSGTKSLVTSRAAVRTPTLGTGTVEASPALPPQSSEIAPSTR